MLIDAILNYQFMQYAFICGILIAILIPTIGSFLILRKQTFISETLSHVSLSGVSFGYLLTTTSITVFNPTIWGIIFAVIGAIIIEYLRNNLKGFKELSMMLVMTISIAIAVSLANLNGNNINLSSYLFGSINSITTSEFYFIIITVVLSMLFIIKFYYVLLAISFDEDYSKLRYKYFTLIKYAFVVITALIIALSIKIIGALLIGALIVIPVSSTINNSKSFKTSQIKGIIFSVISVVIGLCVSFYISIPSGASIVLVSVIVMFISKLIWRLK